MPCFRIVQRLRHLRTSRQIDAVVDDELRYSLRALVDRHLSECADCSNEVAVRLAMKDALAHYGDDPTAVARLHDYADEITDES